MKKVLKQTLSVLLAVVMTFTITLPAFSQEEKVPETQTQQELSYNSSNALGNTLASAMNEEDENREEYDGKGIFNVSITGLEATVSMSAPDDCTVVVALYEEETMQMVTSGKTPVSSEDTAVTVTLAEYELPDFFVIKAFILNSDNAPVCPEYVNLENTKIFVESLSKTTADFDSELVINLDESETDNFAVVSENAQTAQTNKETNILVSSDEDNGVFVIENADESITSLKEGDVLYFTYGEGEDDYILTKIGSIKTKDGITTITASDDYEMSELFEYIHVDTTKRQQEDSKARGFNDDEGSVDEDGKSFDISSDGFVEFPKNDEDADWSLKLYFTGFVGFCVKFHYDFKLFGKDYYNFEYWVSVSAAAIATFDFETEKEKTIELVDTDFKIVPGLEIHFALRLTVKVAASLHVQGRITFFMKNGARRNSDSGQEKIQQEPTFTFEANVEGDYSIDLIPEIETGFRVLKVFFVDLTVPITFNVSGTLYVPTSAEEIEKHPCITCIDGTVTAKIKLGITVKFGFKRDNAIIIIDITPVNKKISLGKYERFYLSGSENGLEPGLGTCPRIVEAIAGGMCGESVAWAFYNTGELVIGGNGDMINLGGCDNKGEWQNYADSITSVRINHGVTSIGDYAFYRFEELTSVIIPDSVISIGDDAFSFCKKLESINIPNSVTSIGSFAFDYCEKLESINIPNSVTRIGRDAFYSCTSLRSIILPDKLTTINSATFRECGELTSIIIPDSVTSIGGFAFEGCSNLTTVYYTGTVEQWSNISIGSNNTELTNATIIFNHTGSTASVMTLSLKNEIAAYSPRTAVQSETVASAVIGNSYVMLVVKDADAEDLLAPENLLYIDQKTAESETLSFDFVVDESETQYSVLFFGEKLPHYHLYKGVITVEPTCTENGVKTFTCECADSYTETIDATGHSHKGEVTAPTCTEQGYATYTCSCGDSYIDNYVDATGHSHKGEVTAPTCTEQGYTTYTCSCGDSYIDNYVNATGHTDEIIPGTAATCTETGLTDGVKCSVCGVVTTEQKTIPVVSHNDNNSDGLCDDCGFDSSKDCSHACHSTNSFVKFFWKILNFFQKLFGVKSARYCDCGVSHW